MTCLFESDVPFAAEGVETVVVYCSDGRFGEAFEQFMERGLKLKRYDRLVLPGGPAVLADNVEEAVWGQVGKEALEFLVRGHRLRRVVLIVHEDCGFYKHRLGVSADRMEERQMKDLKNAAKRLKERLGVEDVQTYVARIQQGKIVFQQKDNTD